VREREGQLALEGQGELVIKYFLFITVLFIAVIFLFAQPIQATTWYVRTDGGTATQCTGTTNAAYPGSGSAQPCAVNHPFWLLNQSTFAWLISGGDTVQFEDVGPYYMGQKNSTSGIGTGWSPFCGSLSGSGNTSSCIWGSLPSGSMGAPTRILGLGAGNCHQTDPNMLGPSALTGAWSGHGMLKNATQLLGINGAFGVMNLEGAAWIDVECFDISQPTTCTAFGVDYTHCTSSASNDWAKYGVDLADVTHQGPINAVLKDIAVHGMENECFHGGHLNSAGTDTFTASDIYLFGCGGAGWNFDGGSCGNSCENLGTMNISWLRIEWAGCVEVKPNGGSIGGAGYTLCADDNHGGYGDGWALIATQGTFNVNHAIFRWNTQDGFDSLHTGDDQAHLPTALNISNSWSEGNEGQTFKMGVATAALAYNNVSISNCRRLGSAFSPNPTGYNTDLSDFCRASGDEWAIELLNGNSVTLEHNTSTGYGATMFDIFCVGGGTCTTTTQMTFKDNLSMGFVDPNTSTLAAGINFGTTNPFGNAGSSIDHNLWFSMKNGTCPQDATNETNAVCADPHLTSESNIDAIVPTLLSTSNAKYAGVTIGGQTTDFLSNSWNATTPSIGAYEFGSQISGASDVISNAIFGPTIVVH